MPEGETTFEEVFSVLHRGHSEIEGEFIKYHFAEDAVEEVKFFYNKLVTRKAQITWDENRRGVLSKARGQFMRLCMIKQAVQDALNAIDTIKRENGNPLNKDDDDLEWRRCIITKDTVIQSAALMEYLIEVSKYNF